MSSIENLRRAHKKLIDFNPSIITIKRERKIEKDGGLEIIREEIGNIRVRIFLEGEHVVPSLIRGLAGEKDIERKWGLIAEWNADIQASPYVQDRFSCELGDFEVVQVSEMIFGGECWGKYVELRRIK